MPDLTRVEYIVLKNQIDDATKICEDGIRRCDGMFPDTSYWCYRLVDIQDTLEYYSGERTTSLLSYCKFKIEYLEKLKIEYSV